MVFLSEILIYLISPTLRLSEFSEFSEIFVVVT
jgi:hypothetical protein